MSKAAGPADTNRASVTVFNGLTAAIPKPIKTMAVSHIVICGQQPGVVPMVQCTMDTGHPVLVYGAPGAVKSQCEELLATHTDYTQRSVTVYVRPATVFEGGAWTFLTMTAAVLCPAEFLEPKV